MTKKTGTASATHKCLNTEFSWWVRKSTGPLTFPVSASPASSTAISSAPTAPALSTAATTTNAPVVAPTEGSGTPGERPKAFITNHFKPTPTVPFGTTGRLPICDVVSPKEIIVAALSGGYGPRNAWSGSLTMPVSEHQAMWTYLRRRLEMTQACLHHQGGRLTPRDFFESVEATEKGALSFIIGGIGTYLAASRWLNASGRKLERCLHTGVFRDATLVTPSAKVNVLHTSRIPDFLVLDSANDWHVFESKGGVFDKRWGQLLDGLKQLGSVSQVGYAGAGLSAPASKVCVQTVVEHGRDLSLTVIDPPPETTDNGPGREDEEAPSGTRIAVVQSVARVIEWFEAVDWFECIAEQLLSTDESTRFVADRWTFRKSTAFDGVVVGIPTAYIKRRQAIVRPMREFVAVKSALETTSSNARRSDLTGDEARATFNATFLQELTFRLSELPADGGAANQPLSAAVVITRLAGYPRAGHEAEVLNQWSTALGFDVLANDMEVEYQEARAELGEKGLIGGPNTATDAWLTPGGLYVAMSPQL